MKFYDCDDEAQFEELRTRVDGEDLVGRNRLQAFAPDTPDEAINRGYAPALKSAPFEAGPVN
jgi:hypothetical protein